MRDFGKVAPQFWIGRTGKSLRAAGMESQIVGLYLLTNPHANMLGLYYLPVEYIAHETGLGMQGASKGLSGCINAGFCKYDTASEMVWVVEMARFQIGASLTDGDKRIKGVQSDYDALPYNDFLEEFFDQYGESFKMVCKRHVEAAAEQEDMASEGNASPFEAPSEPLASKEKEKEKEKERRFAEGASCETDASSSTPPTQRASRLAEDWSLPESWAEWAMQEQPTWDEAHCRSIAERFRDYWIAKPGKDGRKADWLATWRNWVRREQPMKGGAVRGQAGIFAGVE